KLTTYNLSGNVAYQLAPGFTIGAGLQLQYAKGVYKFAATPAVNAPDAGSRLTDHIGVGFAAGLMWQPTAGTSIGLGFRSSITHDFEGDFFDDSLGVKIEGFAAELKTPETVTLSIRQAITPSLRGLASVEWTNWSRFGDIPIY